MSATLGFRQQDAELKERILQRRRNDERAAQSHQRTMRWLRMLQRALQLLHETAGAFRLPRPRPPPPARPNVPHIFLSPLATAPPGSP